jgi:hypothetical protein
MKFPQRLYHGYGLLCKTDLIQHGDVSPRAINTFETLLNETQPPHEDKNMMAKYDIVRALYYSNPNGYINMIRRSGAGECTILWTEPKSIVKFFRLYGKIFISYNRETRNYNVSLHKSYQTERREEAIANLISDSKEEVVTLEE